MTALPMAVFPASNDDSLLDQIGLGNNDAFNSLIVRYHSAMVSVARAQVRSDALAEEAVQEAWIAILKGHRRFERRSSLKTWMFRIVINRARSCAAREHRGDWLREIDEAAIDEGRFDPAGSWAVPPRPWTPEELMRARELGDVVQLAMAQLPPMQQQVITLRDVHGWTAAEVGALYNISDANQRILLHRARTRVRRALEDLFSSEERSCQPK